MYNCNLNKHNLSQSELAIWRQLELSENASYMPVIIAKFNTPTKSIWSDFHSRLTVINASICASDTTDDIINLIKSI